MGNLEVNPSICFPRQRPNEFFPQLKETNRFLRKLCGGGRNFFYFELFERLSIAPFSLTHDGVHYTNLAHQKLGIRIRELFLRELIKN